MKLTRAIAIHDNMLTCVDADKLPVVFSSLKVWERVLPGIAADRLKAPHVLLNPALTLLPNIWGINCELKYLKRVQSGKLWGINCELKYLRIVQSAKYLRDQVWVQIFDNCAKWQLLWGINCELKYLKRVQSGKGVKRLQYERGDLCSFAGDDLHIW